MCDESMNHWRFVFIRRRSAPNGNTLLILNYNCFATILTEAHCFDVSWLKISADRSERKWATKKMGKHTKIECKQSEIEPRRWMTFCFYPLFSLMPQWRKQNAGTGNAIASTEITLKSLICLNLRQRATCSRVSKERKCLSLPVTPTTTTTTPPPARHCGERTKSIFF